MRKDKCPIAERVSKRVIDRSVVGLEKYGVTADRDDLSIPQWLRHLQEELLDGAVYAEKAIKEHQSLIYSISVVVGMLEEAVEVDDMVHVTMAKDRLEWLIGGADKEFDV